MSAQSAITPSAASAGGPLRERQHTSWWARNQRSVLVWGLRVAVLAVVVIVWQVLSGPVLDPTFISRPSDIYARLVDWLGDGTLADNTWITVQEIVIGFVIGAFAGAVTAYIFTGFGLLYDVLEPIVMALYAIPKVALAPLFIVWFGIGLEMKVLLAAISVFFLVFINTAAGVRDVDRGLIDAVRLMGASRLTIVRKVVLPASLNGLITGLRVAVPYALIGAVIGELVASNHGLGFLINDSAARFDIAGVFATVLVLTVVAAVLNIAVGTLAKRANRWKPPTSQE